MPLSGSPILFTGSGTALNADMPNLPSDCSYITSHNADVALPSLWTQTTGPTLGTDSTAPYDNHVMDAVYNAGGPPAGGSAPCNLAFALAAMSSKSGGLFYSRLYVRYIMKLSSNWLNNTSNGTVKIMLLDQAGGRGNVAQPVPGLIGGGANPSFVNLFQRMAVDDAVHDSNFDGAFNVQSSAGGQYINDQWSMTEYVWDANTANSLNGRWRTWIANNFNVNPTPVQVQDITSLGGSSTGGKIQSFRWQPVWGGSTTPPTLNQYMRMKRIDIYGRI